MEKIPFFRPSIGEEEVEATTEVMRSGHLTIGERVAEFERKFGEYIGAKHCVATSSLTNGYLLVLDHLKPEWVSLPSMTFVSMANIPRLLGIEIKLTDDVHVGHSYPIFTDSKMVVDSAHQIERGLYRGFRDFWLFSFHATKNMTTGEGGMVVCPNRGTCQRLKDMRDCGMLHWARHWDYTVERPGWYAYMTDLNAAVGLAQLEKLDAFNMMKQMIVDSYNELLGEGNTSLHLYTILVDRRDKFIRYMERNGVECSVHYYRPIHRQPAFGDIGKRFPHTEDIAERTVSLPLYPEMEYKDVRRVCDLVNGWRGK